jgi:uncharacterized protein (TIGR02452 family)
MNNIEILEETLQILDAGHYEVNGKVVKLRLSKEQMVASHVLLPADVQDICGRKLTRAAIPGQCRIGCVKQDSYVAAIEMMRDRQNARDQSKPVLVLNFANPVNIGGGVYKGAKTQEEDLCRRSSLLRSLETQHSLRYYNYNRKLHTHMGSDAMIFSPEVEIFRDEYGGLMDETVIVAVLTCAAPMISYGMEGMSEREYRYMFYNRIVGMMKCAAYFGYEDLVLGAWGCGAFGNDAAVVSDMFCKALMEQSQNGVQTKDLFRRIVFAVRSRGEESYNYIEFKRNF